MPAIKENQDEEEEENSPPPRTATSKNIKIGAKNDP